MTGLVAALISLGCLPGSLATGFHAAPDQGHYGQSARWITDDSGRSKPGAQSLRVAPWRGARTVSLKASPGSTKPSERICPRR